MVIIQLSDFHINNKTDISKFKKKIDIAYNELKKKNVLGNKIVVCICGDIFDHGDKSVLTLAKESLEYIQNKLVGSDYSFEFVPGNHDIIESSFSVFDNLIAPFITKDKYAFSSNSIVLREYEAFDLLLVNSAYKADFSYGAVDFEELIKIISLSAKPKIILTHHSIISRYDDDVSGIRNAHELVKIVSSNNVIAYLHGHTHGYDDMRLGDSCKVIGTGPFSKQMEDVNSQFNIIYVVANDIAQVRNFSFRADLSEYTSFTCFEATDPHLIKGHSVKRVFDEVLSKTIGFGCIYNLNIYIQTDANRFLKEIEKYFEKQIDTATQWQMKVVPETLYYNHGMYTDKAETSGMDHVIKELKNKATSSRSIIPLINISDVIKSGDGFLPSLDIIQFGFKDEKKDELYATLYLRALEVNHFLRINLCEIYLMSKKIMNTITSIQKLNINIFAFRAQYRETFGCFQKAKIDTLDPTELGLLVANESLIHIADLLDNKSNLSETVIIENGILNLCKAIEKQFDMMGEKCWISKEIINVVLRLKSNYKGLKDMRERTSVYIKIEEIESLVKKDIDNLKQLIIDIGGEK